MKAKKSVSGSLGAILMVVVLIPQHMVYAEASVVSVPNLPDVIERAMPSVCRITAWEDDYSARWKKLWQILNEAKNQNKNLISIPQGVRGELGSCVVRNAETGIILTAHHVIQDKNFFVMRLMGNAREYVLEKMGSDAATDFAVLRVKNPNDLPLPVASVIFGNSDALRPGDAVFAVGYPATEMNGLMNGVLPRDEVGYEEHYPSVVAGIISGHLRYVNLLQFIQTDAITDSGYSGGGIFNINGELVAMPDEALGRGQSYGIAVNQIALVAAEIERYGKIEHGALGVAWSEMRTLVPFSAIYLNVTPELRQQYLHSLVVVDFAAKSVARDAGIKIGDIITHIDGMPAQSAKLAQQYIGWNRPGTDVKFSIVRQGMFLEITVILGVLTENSMQYQAPE